MTPEQFCYWLQGYFEISNSGGTLDTRQAEEVKRHLALVFEKRTPSITTTMPGVFRPYCATLGMNRPYNGPLDPHANGDP